MNIDERLEALTQSVELLASMQKTSEQRAAKQRVETYMARMMQSITRLSNIASVHSIAIEDHQQRIEDLEGPNG